MNKVSRRKFLEERARHYGFSHVGIAKAEFMDEEARRLEDWLNKNHHAKMTYMENHFDKRVDPTKLVPGAKSVISLMFNYYPEETIQNDGQYKIARYAYGKDYHKFIKKKLIALFRDLQAEIGEINGRMFVDSAPVLERDWAKRSGLGWVGKNTLLINKDKGSYYFLAEMITDLEFSYDHPIKDYCGTCTRCIDACPTDAISENGYILDAGKCISYLTIELKEKIPEEFRGKMEDWIFGCDICQEVCPWNRFSEAHNESRLTPKEELKNMTKRDWEEITEEVFEKLFEGTAVRRTKYSGLKRNIEFVKNKYGK